MMDIPSRPKSILIVRLSAIGDVVHTLPVVGVLRKHNPDISIGWLVEELPAQLLEGHPDIDDLFVIPKRKWRNAPLRTWLNGEKGDFYSKIRRKQYAVGIDFQGLTKSGFALWMGGARCRIGYGDHDGRELNKVFTNVKVCPPDDKKHVIERNLSLLSPLGIRPEPDEIRWTFPEFTRELEALQPFLTRVTGSRPILLYPGAGWPTKCWPVEHFTRLAEAICRESSLSDRSIMIVWGPAEKQAADAILEQARPACGDRLLLAPSTNLRELTVLLDHAGTVVGGDTGPIHIAAALGKPVIGLYGASDPERNGPWGKGHQVLISRQCALRPCWKHECPQADAMQCMRDIAPSEVLRCLLTQKA